jgi:hypothetical protein
MAWDKELATLDEVPAHFHSFYKEIKEGDTTKYVLEDIAPLKNALTHTKAERDEARKKAKEVDAWKTLGKTPEEIAALVAAADEAAAKKAKESGDFEAILAQHRTKAAEERAAAERERDTWKNNYVAVHVNTGLMQALNLGEATAEGIEVLPQILASRAKAEAVDGKVSVTILDTAGNAMAGSGADGKATFGDLVKEAKVKFPSLFKGNGNSGSGASNGTGKSAGGAPGNLKRSAMTIPQKTDYIAEHGQEAFLKLPY